MKHSLLSVTNRGLIWVWAVLLAVAAQAAFPAGAQAEVRLPHIFGSHMVFQREKPIVVWGWASPNETVAVKLGDESGTATANDKGEWKVTLPAMEASGPFTLTVSGSNTITDEDVMIGDVWVCSGQSNMEFGLGNVNHASEEITNANHPGLRLLMVQNNWTPQPWPTWMALEGLHAADSGGGWLEWVFRSGLLFGRELNQKLGVTIGLIDADWGGTRIESWTPPEGFAAVSALKSDYDRVEMGDPTTAVHRQKLAATLDQYDQWLQSARKAMNDQQVVPSLPAYPDDLLPPHDLQNPTALYNAMIHPLTPFPIRGAIWYQGEANESEGMKYAERMKGLVAGWRTVWNEGDFPFYFVQIAPYNYGDSPEKLAELWEAQTVAANEIPNAGMAVVNDIGNLHDIHPKDKQDVGHRLALIALAKTYGETNIVYSGPTFKSMEIEGDKLRVHFDHVGGGLTSRDGKPLSWFEIIDADDGGYVPADAQIDGDSVVLSAAGVQHPVAMRFAWSDQAEPNLMNAEGLPAERFRAGELPKRDWLGRHIPDAKDYQVVYELNLNGLGSPLKYDVDQHADIHRPFDRIGYFLELQDGNFNSQDIFVSMDAFTDDASRIGVPVYGSGAFFQQNVTNLDVYSNVKGIVTGTGLTGGNIEFWPNNYAQGNSANVPNASGSTFDFGDQPTEPADGYGSMQVHNHDAKQTLFALNHWGQGTQADVGIGNRATDDTDWTFAHNAGDYRAVKLVVMVHYRQ